MISSISNKSVSLIVRTLTGTTTQIQVELGVRKMKGYTTPLIFWRYPWCKCYHCRRWTQWQKFKSWTRLITFHITLILSERVRIQLSSLQVWVNRIECFFFFWFWYGNQWRNKENSHFKPVKPRLKLTACRILIVWKCWVNTWCIQ